MKNPRILAIVHTISCTTVAMSRGFDIVRTVSSCKERYESYRCSKGRGEPIYLYFSVLIIWEKTFQPFAQRRINTAE